MADTEFNLEELIRTVTGTEETAPQVRVAEGESSKAKAESGM